MWLDRAWGLARRFVPVRAYPLLAPVRRWQRRRHLDWLVADDARHRAADPSLVAPPAELRYNVAGPTTIPLFLAAGTQTVADIDRALQSVGRALTPSTRLLDFGCGCGRLLIALERREPLIDLTGCDVDARAVEWCQHHLRRTRSVVTDALPPLPFAPGSFDVVWCGSVFTHLDERRQDLWLQELSRVLAPGGVLLASVHGPRTWESRLPERTVAQLRQRGMLFARYNADAGVHPEWYQVAWHTEEYVRRHWGTMFRVSNYLPGGLHGYQDVVVAEKR